MKEQKIPWIIPRKGVVFLDRKGLEELVGPEQAKLFIKLRNIKSVEVLEKTIKRLV